MVIQKKLSFLTPWFIWGLAAFFFFAHYVVRVTPGQITEELQATFTDTSKMDIGILGSSFYLPYILMQLPVGYLVDRFGSRLLLTFAVFICSLSSLIFANADALHIAILSRVLLGFCSATAFISALKLTTVWFEPQKLALLIGITQALGMLGAATGAGLVPYMNHALGWQNTFYVYSIIFLVLTVLIYAVVRDHPKNYQPLVLNKNIPIATLPTLAEVLCNKYTWINALYAGFIYAPTDAMGELWGTEFIKHIHHLEGNGASKVISLLFIGWAIGGPFAGSLADHVGRRPVMIGSAILGLILLPLMFYMPGLSLGALMIIMFLYGLTNTGLIASYTTAGELHSNEHAGFSMAITNMFSILLGAMFMPLLGWLLEGYAIDHHYTVTDYQRATLVLPLCMFLAIICSLFIKETLPHAK